MSESPPSKRQKTQDPDPSPPDVDSTPDTPNPVETSSSSLPMPISAKPKRIPKQKMALFIGYCGEGYHGMQKNNGVKTIEGEIEIALNKGGAVSNDNTGSLQKIGWQRCARTDKNVHAVGQLASLKMMVFPGVIEQINQNLPPHIRIFDMKRVTFGFDAKGFCVSRVYDYLLPTCVLNPRPEGSLPKTKPRPQEIGKMEEKIRLKESPYPEVGLTEEARARFDGLLKVFEGTRNFHNYTSGANPKDQNSKRFIISFKTQEVITLSGIEFVRLEVKGQSFLLHHIRKMIGTALALYRHAENFANPREALLSTMTERKYLLPRAPGIGLYLRQCNFDGYNKLHGKLHGELIPSPQVMEQMEKFKHQYIYPQIAKTELEEFSIRQWVSEIDAYPFELTDVTDLPQRTFVPVIKKKESAQETQQPKGEKDEANPDQTT